MDTVVIAYLIVWLAVVIYVARLGARQRTLLQNVNTLIAQSERSEPSDSSSSILPS